MTGPLFRLTPHTNTVAFSDEPESEDVTSDMVRLGVAKPADLPSNLPGNCCIAAPKAVEVLHW